MYPISSLTRIDPVHNCAYQLCNKTSREALGIDGGEGTSTVFLDMAETPLNIWFVFVGRNAIEFDMIVIAAKVVTETFKRVVHKYALDL